MEHLLLLLRELIEHAVPAGNKRGELHALVDKIEADAATPPAPAPVAPQRSNGPAKA